MRFGAFLAFIGFGSALLHFTDVQFRLVMWAEPFQPPLGIGIGVVGLLIFGIVHTLQQRKQAPEAPPAYQPPQQQYPPQQFAPPPQQFAAPPQQFAAQPQFQQPYPPPPYQPQYPQQPMPPRQGPPPGYPYGQPPR